MDAGGSPDRETPNDREEPDNRPSPVTMLVVIVLVIGISFFLAMKLKEMSRLQDCLMSGRTNCAPVEAPKTP